MSYLLATQLEAAFFVSTRAFSGEIGQLPHDVGEVHRRRSALPFRISTSPSAWFAGTPSGRGAEPPIVVLPLFRVRQNFVRSLNFSEMFLARAVTRVRIRVVLAD
jgi:hypothetical protein